MQAAASLTGQVQTAGDLEGALRAMMLDGTGTERRLKTFIVDLDGDGPPRGRGGVEWDVLPAGIAGVSYVSRRGAGAGACELVLDRRRGRFCMAHTSAADGNAGDTVSLLARTTGLGRAWVCPAVLGMLAGAAGNGTASGGTIRMSRGDSAGHAEADVRCDGVVMHAGGGSVGAHLEIAGEVRDAYARMCENAERFRLGAMDTPDGRRIGLRPIDMAFSRKIEDVSGLIDRVFDGKPPLMMRGNKIHIAGDQYHVPTANMEEMHHMGIDVTPRFLSVGIQHGCSAGGVLRLLAHLQLHHDRALTCEQVTAGVCGA